jgi:hypothetical protein
MNTKEAAKYLNVSPSLLEHLRSKGGGPRYSKNGRIIDYDKPDCDDWKESHKISSRAEELARKQSKEAAKLEPAAPKPHQHKPRKRQLKPRTPPDSHNNTPFPDQAR